MGFLIGYSFFTILFYMAFNLPKGKNMQLARILFSLTFSAACMLMIIFLAMLAYPFWTVVEKREIPIQPEAFQCAWYGWFECSLRPEYREALSNKLGKGQTLSDTVIVTAISEADVAEGHVEVVRRRIHALGIGWDWHSFREFIGGKSIWYPPKAVLPQGGMREIIMLQKRRHLDQELERLRIWEQRILKKDP